MTGKQFFDWQTGGGTNDVMKMIAALEVADISWCAIRGIAVNHWAEEPVVTRDVDFVVAASDVEKAVSELNKAGFESESFEWSTNFKGNSKVSLQLSTEEMYKDFVGRSVPADVHGILMRVASLEDTLQGKMAAWRDDSRRQSKRIKDLGDIARLVECHSALYKMLDVDLQKEIQQPET